MSTNASRGLLVFGGERKSGKDFLAEYVQKQYGPMLIFLVALEGDRQRSRIADLRTGDPSSFDWERFVFHSDVVRTTEKTICTGIDDAESECGLDTGVVQDITIHDDEDQFNRDISKILEHVKAMLA